MTHQQTETSEQNFVNWFYLVNQKQQVLQHVKKTEIICWINYPDLTRSNHRNSQFRYENDQTISADNGFFFNQQNGKLVMTEDDGSDDDEDNGDKNKNLQIY